MLKDYPVIINSIALFPPSQWEEHWEKVTNKYSTEAGTEQIDVVRIRKLSVTAQFRCSSAWVSRFIGWNQFGTLTVQIYDLQTDQYATRYMHMEDLTFTLVQGSEKANRTNGLYEVSFTLEEF